MTITVNRQEFVNTLKDGGSMAGRSKTVPVLNYSRIIINGDSSYSVSSSDGEVGIIKNGVLKGAEQDCSFCVQPKELADILSTIKDDEVSFNLKDSCIEVYHSKGDIVVPILPSDDFIMPSYDGLDKSVNVPSTELYGCLKNARIYCGVDELRPTLTGVLMRFQGDSIMLAASDAHKLYIDAFKVKENFGEERTELIIPNRAIKPIMDAIYSSQDVDIRFGGTSIQFSTGDTIVTSRLIVGKYPDVSRLVSNDHRYIISVNKTTLLESLSRTLLSANSSTKLLKFGINTSAEKLTIISEDLGFNKRSQDVIAIEVEQAENENFNIGVKGSSLIDCISSVDAEDVVFRFIDNKKAIQILDKERESKKIILMPFVID